MTGSADLMVSVISATRHLEDNGLRPTPRHLLRHQRRVNPRGQPA
jgi:hypothetical protein